MYRPTHNGRTWVCDVHIATAFYWLKRGELPEAIFRKGYMALWWDVWRVWLGPPRGNRADGNIGIYAERSTQ